MGFKPVPSLGRVFFSVALSLSRQTGQLPLATTLPYGARTFLPEQLMLGAITRLAQFHVITTIGTLQAHLFISNIEPL
jgi:hypothetical protein